MKRASEMILGIDATNITSGGGMTHLKELLNQHEVYQNYFDKIVLWASTSTLSKIPVHFSIIKKTHPFLNKGIFFRIIWQLLYSKRDFTKEKINILFNPGGAYVGKFRPYVTMSRNMLVFDEKERSRYGLSVTRIRLKILNWVQSFSIKNAEAIIFISRYAESVIKANFKQKKSILIHHGISERFKYKEKRHLEYTDSFESKEVFVLTYISIIDVYKHQWNVVEAVYKLRKKGYPLILNLIGGNYGSALMKLKKSIEEFDSDREFVKLCGLIPYEDIDAHYNSLDLFVFASTCENMPNILIEAMASGLPIVCSNHHPMPEFLKDAGMYFDPLDANSIAFAIEKMIVNPDLRVKSGKKAFEYSKQFDWGKCANQTFQYLQDIASYGLDNEK